MNMVLLPEVVYQGQDRYCRYRTSPISTACLKRALAYHQSLTAAEGGWTTVYLENHDQARSISRFADASTEELRTRSGKLLTILLTTLSGTLFLYQGQEIGMLNVPRTWAVEDYKDCQALNYVDRVRGESPGDEVAFREAMDGINLVARDNGRTPVQWNDGPNAGFTTGKPWTRVNDNYKIINVAKQRKDPESLLNFWRGMIMLRKRLKELLVYGEFVLFEVDKEGEMTYGKIQGEAKILVYLNFSNERMKLHIPEGWKLGTKLVGNLDGTKLEPLEPWEGRIYTAY
jgi:oligo-1,6-glucosidase